MTKTWNVKKMWNKTWKNENDLKIKNDRKFWKKWKRICRKNIEQNLKF